jgi:hypothetical protein
MNFKEELEKLKKTVATLESLATNEEKTPKKILFDYLRSHANNGFKEFGMASGNVLKNKPEEYTLNVYVTGLEPESQTFCFRNETSAIEFVEMNAHWKDVCLVHLIYKDKNSESYYHQKVKYVKESD